jgi:CDP-glycerol glycerophosphotransferase (TagB/SpsB family)
MNSWDNPAVKAMMLGAPDRLVVWGEHSRQLAHERLDIPLDRLMPIGAAQFDVCRDPPREDPASYRKRLGVPEGNRLLLYAGSSKGLNETAHLVRLEEAAERGELPRTTVLFRPHPWRGQPAGEVDFYARAWKHVIMAPDMADYYRKSRTGQVQFFMADYVDTHVTLSAVDAVISPLSTILLEAAMHGKPSVAYLPDEDMRTNSALFTMVRTVHFRTFFEKLDCIQCGTPEALVADARRLLDQTGDAAHAERIRRQSEYFAVLPPRPYTELLDELIQGLVAAPALRAAAGS